MWDLIKQLCKEKSITINQLCDKLGVSYQALSVSVKRDMRVSTLKRIADALDVAPSVLLDDTTATPDNTTATSNQITCPVCHSVLTFSVVDSNNQQPSTMNK